MSFDKQEWLGGLLGLVGIVKPDSEMRDDYSAEVEGDMPEEEYPEEIQEESPPLSPESDIILTRNVNSRPQDWDSFVGQSNHTAVDRLKMAISAADQEQRNLPHILLYGGPGLGKTTLARIMAHETNTKIIETVGCSISKQQDIYSLFCDIQLIQERGERAILFIDEIHDVAKNTPETIWFPILEDFVFHHCLRNTKVMYDGRKYLVANSSCELEPFTIIGATTDPGLLSAPLRDRFPIACYLNPYTDEDLKKILLNFARAQDIEIIEEAAFSLARRARGTPRTAINLLIACKDRAIVSNSPITKEIVAQQMNSDGIDDEGLTMLDLKVLVALSKTAKGLGISNLAGSAGVTRTTITEMVEPLLKQRGYMETTNKRILTDKGRKLLKSKNL